MGVKIAANIAGIEYSMEELLPIVAKLTDKYTSKESSSVTYDTARMLMEAVIYCIKENEQENAVSNLHGSDNHLAEVMYEKGCQRVKEKALLAKEIYHGVIDPFEDYGCMNYADTICKGMPEFFKWYDMKFEPQNHLLTLDYPLLMGNPNLCGVDLILEYLKKIQLEKAFLDCFDKKDIISLLGKLMPEYRTLYLDNICEPVLLNAIGCFIADCPVNQLSLSKSDCDDIYFYFEGDTVKKIEDKITKMTGAMLKRQPESAMYFAAISNSYAIRIWNGVQNKSLENVMVIDS